MKLFYGSTAARKARASDLLAVLPKDLTLAGWRKDKPPKRAVMEVLYLGV